MILSDAEGEKGKTIYKLESPEGGWGNVIAIAMAVMFIVTVSPLASFGIIYGKFLTNFGDEASGTAIINCLFNTIYCFMDVEFYALQLLFEALVPKIIREARNYGLVANHQIQKQSCRYVGVIGAIFFFIGNFLTAFASSLLQIIITFGVLQGIGFGLMLSATFASFNEYFIVRKNVMMGISQTIIGAVTMVMPYFSRVLMDEYGFRGTVAIFSALSLNALAAMFTLQPVEWHMNKVPVSAIEMSFIRSENSNEKNVNNTSEKTEHLSSNDDKNDSCMMNLWNSISSFLELSLLKDPSYVNISVGLSLSFLSDIMFLSMLPMFLYHMEFNNEEIAYLMTVFMAADLIGRILMSLLNTKVKINSRILFLYGSAITALARIVFTMHSGEWIWIMILIIIIGLIRCLIQVTIPLVLAEYSQTRFPAAFGLYLAICGVISLASGQISSLVAINTTGDTWMLHFLNLQIILCVLPWTIEMICNKKKK